MKRKIMMDFTPEMKIFPKKNKLKAKMNPQKLALKIMELPPLNQLYHLQNQ